MPDDPNGARRPSRPPSRTTSPDWETQDTASLSRGRTIGRRLRELRTARSWSQGELASRAAVGVATVRRYERGLLRVESLLKLAQAVGTSLDELVAPADPNPCRRAVLDRLPACSELPPHLAPLLVSVMDFVIHLHRSTEELAGARCSPSSPASSEPRHPPEAGGLRAGLQP
jgi:transcriptional regulator with XRE-family HTH domain